MIKRGKKLEEIKSKALNNEIFEGIESPDEDEAADPELYKN